MSRQDCTNPTYLDLQEIMSLRSGLDDESSYMEEELGYFLNYNEMFVNEAPFYEEISALGKATEGTVYDAFSLSGRYLQRVTDVDGIFQSSKIACLQLASDIMAFVDKDTAINPTEARRLAVSREALVKKFARLKGSWENLLQATLDYDESVVFAEVSEIVEVTEVATNQALFRSEDLLRSLHDHNLCERVGVEEMGDAHEVVETSDTEGEEADVTRLVGGRR